MATTNKAISAYLPPDIEEYLTQYCKEHNITRKDKDGNVQPSLGTATVKILKIFFDQGNVQVSLPDNVPLLPSNVVTKSDLSDALSTVPSIIEKKIEIAIASLEQRLQPTIDAGQQIKKLGKK